MKKLLKVLFIGVLFIACKKGKPTVDSNKKTEKVSVESKVFQKKEIKEQEQTIEGFLKDLQIAVKNNDIININKLLKYPLEFSSGGEASMYNSYKELKNDGSDEEFLKILEAKYIGKEEGYYMLEYQDPSNVEYFITFLVKKENNIFRLVSYQEPH